MKHPLPKGRSLPKGRTQLPTSQDSLQVQGNGLVEFQEVGQANQLVHCAQPVAEGLLNDCLLTLLHIDRTGAFI